MLGTTWQVIANLAEADKAPVEAVLPSEGATGWSDTWMVAAKAKHPNCAYLWMNWIVSPEVNAQVAEWFGEAPSNKLACAQTADKNFCDTYHAADEDYFQQGLVLDHADHPVPRRAYERDLQGLRGLDPGLDRDQGLMGSISATADRPGVSPARPARLASWLHHNARVRLAALLSAPLAWLLLAYLGSLAGVVRLGILDRQRLHRRRDPPADPGQLPYHPAASRSIAPSRCAASAWPPRSPSSTR